MSSGGPEKPSERKPSEGAGGTGSSLRDGIDPYEHLHESASAADRCPHCGGVGRVVTDDELRYVCSLCGGPRFGALAPGLVPPEPAERALRDAQKARKARAGWTAVAAASGVGTAFIGLTAAVFLAAGAITAALVVGAVFLVPFVIAFLLGWSKRGAAAAKITPAIDAAWAALAAGAAHAGRAHSPAELAKALGVGETQAEQLHTVLAVDAALGARTDNPRVRIGDTEIGEPPRSVLAPDPRFDALEAKARAADEAARAEAEQGEEEAARDTLARAKTIIAGGDGSGGPA